MKCFPIFRATFQNMEGGILSDQRSEKNIKATKAYYLIELPYFEFLEDQDNLFAKINCKEPSLLYSSYLKYINLNTLWCKNLTP